MFDRRDFLIASATAGVATGLSACMGKSTDRWGIATRALRAPLGADPGVRDFVRCATLASSGHNTQPWRFATKDDGVDIFPDFTRRTPVVDPDDHHLFVSLGCAAENLAISARASGRPANVDFDPAGSGRLAVTLARGVRNDVALCRAIPARQSTRSLYDGRAVSSADLKSLAQASAIPGVSVLLLTDARQREAVLESVIDANDAQIDDPAFMAELIEWLRFNEDDALRTGDGLYPACSGSRTAPTWIGKRMFPVFFTKASEAKRYAAQIRSSSGIAVFVGARADRDHWVRVGRSFQRFALHATVLGLRHAHINQPIEVSSVRSAFAQSLGLGGVRPDLVVRFGGAPALPMAMRRQPIVS